MGRPETNRNLLFAILAHRNGFVPRDALFGAMTAWLLRREVPLGALLVERGELSEDRRELLENLVQEHLVAHGGDPARSLRSVTSTKDVTEDMAGLDDEDVLASLAEAREGGPVHPPTDASFAISQATEDAGFQGIASPPDRRFQPLRPHAQGGLGIVSIALDSELDREVAFKEIQDRHADQPGSRARFILEAELTGKLEHPGIVPIYGLGLDDKGRPFYAMRLIRGESLAEAIDRFHDPSSPFADPSRRALQHRELLDRFLDVCDALAYAHSRGVIHRDLKPANVMLGPFGETLVVDWGLALANCEVPEGLASPLEAVRPTKVAVDSLPAELGAIVGTPAFMAPEQAAGDSERIGIRSDVYGLGGILYEILTGQRPVSAPSREDLFRAVREGKIVPPRQVRPEIPGALEAICLKALSLRPDDRYADPRELAADVKAWLADEPISAYPEPLPDRVRRWARRHRVLVSTLAASLVVGIFGLAAVLAVQGQKNRELFSKNAELARAIEDKDLQSRRAADRELQAIEAVRRFAESIKAEPQLRRDHFRALREKLLKEPQAFFRSLRDRLLADRDTRAGSLDRLADAAFDLGRLNYQIGDRREALVAFRQALEVREALVAQEPASPVFRSKLAMSHDDNGSLFASTGEVENALRSFGAAIAIRRALASELPTLPVHRGDLAHGLNNRGVLLNEIGRYDEALRDHKEALDLRRRLVEESPNVALYRDDLAGTHLNLGNLLRAIGKPEAALKEYEEAMALQSRLVAESPGDAQYRCDLATNHNNIGALLLSLGRPGEAMKAHQAALSLRRRLVEDDPAIAQYRSDLSLSYHNLGILMRATGRPDEAIEAHRSALSLRRKLVEDDSTVIEYRGDLAASHHNIGAVLLSTGRADEAIRAFEASRDLLIQLADEFPDVLQQQADLAACQTNMGTVYLATERLDQALKAHEAALAIQKRLVERHPDSPEFRDGLESIHNNIGLILSRIGRSDDAIRAHEAALAIARPLIREHPENPGFQSGLGATLNNIAVIDREARRWKEARERLTEAIRWQRKALEANPANPQFREFLENHLTNLVEVAEGLGDKAGAAEARRELDAFVASDPQRKALTLRLAEIFREGAAPPDNPERLRLAQQAYDLGLHAAAARLQRDALASDPKLAEDRQGQLAYNAACSAALAGTDRGRDVPAPSDTDREALRGQALAWLRGELRTWSKALESGAADIKATVSQTLLHWKSDSDLAALREPDGLAKLPERERQDWSALWADVDRLLAKAREQ